jgi:cell division protein ZapA
MSDAMDDQTVNGSGQSEQAFAEIDAATRRLMAALDALERAVERRREADRDEDELAARIQALGADRARLADELDGSRDRRTARCGDRHHPRGAGGGRDAMSHINVTINGRQYRMACEEGQEVRLLKLAEALESRIDSLRGKFGEIGDARLTVMAALTVCDELQDAGNRIRALEEELVALRDVRAVAADRAKSTQVAVANALNAAADRIEKTTQVLNRTVGGGVAIG